MSQLPSSPPRDASEIESYLGAFTNYEKQRPLSPARKAWGPERALSLLKRASLLPSPSCPVVQVAGSKGKGSTVLWLEALLRGRGRRPGAYVSPHLERIHERVRVDGAQSTDDDLLSALGELHPHLQAIEAERPELRPTFFDVWTAVAVSVFRRRGCAPILLEVGLGGPLDSTSAVPHQVGVLTTVDLEHRAELGDTVEEIALEKSKIARDGAAFVCTPAERWRRAVHDQVVSRGARWCEVPDAERSTWPDAVRERVVGPQLENLALARAAIAEIPGEPPVDDDELVRAVDSVVLPGRLETLAGPPPLLLDTAHSPRALAAFARHFRRLRSADTRRGAVLVSFLHGKEWRQGLSDAWADLEGVEWGVVRAPSPRAVEPEEIVAYLRERAATVAELGSLDAAVDWLRAAHATGAAIATTGSFTTAGELRRRWGGAPAR